MSVSRWSAIGLMTVATVAIVGCSGGQGFAPNAWDAFNVGGDGSEIHATGLHEPTDLESLVVETDVAVRGTITAVTGGPTDEPAFNDPAAPLAVLVVAAEYSSDPDLQGQVVKIVTAREPDAAIESLNSELTGQDAMSFIEVSPREGFWNRTWSQAIMIDTSERVEVAGQQAPQDAVPDSVDDLDELEDVVDELSQ